MKRKWLQKTVCCMLGVATAATMLALPSTAQTEFQLSAKDFVAQINCGWNLGNSLDVAEAWGGETGWGNPIVTEEVLDAAVEKGFNTIRIPITWFGEASKVGKITKTRMAKAKKVVDWAMDNDVFVIINAHHEGAWLKTDPDMSQTEMEAMFDNYAYLWEQVATEFKDYNEKLIFESHNEVRYEEDWSGYDEYYDIINRINATFVETVRATGGNNAKRYLVLDTYGATASYGSVHDFVLPDDPANHLIVDVHLYNPYGFCSKPSEESINEVEFNYDSLYNSLHQPLEYLKECFIDKGVPVIIGEMGSVNKDNTADRAEHAVAYVRMAAQYGIKCFWWDDGGDFMLLNRNTMEWDYGEIADAMIEEANKYVVVPEIEYGNVNGDTGIDAKDSLLLRQYIARFDVQIDEAAADVNADGKINSKDSLLLRQYIAQYNVTLGPQS